MVNTKPINITIKDGDKEPIIIDSEGYVLATVDEAGVTGLEISATWSEFSHEEILRVLSSLNHIVWKLYVGNKLDKEKYPSEEYIL